MISASLGARVLPDPDGRTRVVLTGPDLADLLDLAIAQPRRYGAGDPAVLSRLFALLGEVAWVTDDPAHRVAIGSQLTRLRSTVARQSFDLTEVHDLDVLARGVEEALKRR